MSELSGGVGIGDADNVERIGLRELALLVGLDHLI
jgi:hypothetical protein